MSLQPPTCHKKPYRSWNHASHDARMLRRRHEVREEPYYCRRCQAYHVGEKTIMKRRAG